MAAKQSTLTYTFDNPNTAREFEELLKKVIIEKLLACHRKNR